MITSPGQISTSLVCDSTGQWSRLGQSITGVACLVQGIECFFLSKYIKQTQPKIEIINLMVPWFFFRNLFRSLIFDAPMKWLSKSLNLVKRVNLLNPIYNSHWAFLLHISLLNNQNHWVQSCSSKISRKLIQKLSFSPPQWSHPSASRSNDLRAWDHRSSANRDNSMCLVQSIVGDASSFRLPRRLPDYGLQPQPLSVCKTVVQCSRCKNIICNLYALGKPIIETFKLALVCHADDSYVDRNCILLQSSHTYLLKNHAMIIA